MYEGGRQKRKDKRNVRQKGKNLIMDFASTDMVEIEETGRKKSDHD